jgi:ElaB/YqjD/DUF883 family membrane-anchored ribosome-binding protein
MADSWNRTTGQMNKVADTADEIGQRAAARVEDLRVQAVSALETAAYRIEDKVEDVSGSMVKDVGNLVRRYPMQFLTAGLVLGFLLARGLRSSDS